MPPNPQWRHPGEAERVANHGQAQPQWGTPPPGAQANHPNHGQLPPFPPQFQPQPPALPAGGYAPPAHPAGQQQQGQQQYVPQQPAPQNAPPYGYPPQQARPDQGAYDLGSYTMSSGQAPPPHPNTVRSGRPPQPAPETTQQWAPQPVEPYPYTGQPQQAPTAAPQQAGAGYGYQQQVGANVPAAQHEQDAGYEEEVEYEDPPRRSRKWMIAAALIGSIGLGGGIAYGYKSMFSPKAGDKTQVVKAPREPAKVAPADRGGKQFANTDNSTVMNRLPAEGSANAAGGTTDSSGVRRVSTVPVDRNAGAVPPPSSSGPANVPGMMMVGGGNPGMAGVMIAPQPSANAPAQPPQRVAVATPPPPPPVRKAQPVEAPEAAVPTKRLPATTVAAAERVPAPPAAERVKPAGPAGYVAVLGYQRTQMEAMKMMADLQQKYEALRDKKLEIVQSDQTSRGLGVIYRVVVGPRGSIAPARDICARLKEAGMPNTGCYPLAAN